MRSSLPLALVFACSLLGCSQAQPVFVSAVTPIRHAPLPDTLSMVFPAESRSVLGLVYDGSLAEPHAVVDLGELLRDNPCAEHLQYRSETKDTVAADAWPLVEEHPSPLLGLEVFYPASTHLFVVLDAPKLSRVVTTDEYDACCAEADCGDGMVSAVYEGVSNVHPALAVPSTSPPLVLVGQGAALGMVLHEGRTFDGVVAVELSN